MMKASTIREMSADDLNKELLALLKEQFNIRMQKASGQMAKTHILRKNRRSIARIKTIMNEKPGE